TALRRRTSASERGQRRAPDVCWGGGALLRQRHDHRDALAFSERARGIPFSRQGLREPDGFRGQWNLLSTLELDLATAGNREDVLAPRGIVPVGNLIRRRAREPQTVDGHRLGLLRPRSAALQRELSLVGVGTAVGTRVDAVDLD